MPTQPSLASENLILRAFVAEDADRVQLLAGEEKIADTTATIPHPYPEGTARRWIAETLEKWAAGESASFAITLAPDGELTGAISLLHIEDGAAELGYWVGVPYWGRGIATRAVRSVVACGFEQLGLKRIHARVLSRNKASAKVLLRQGFIHIGNESTSCGYRREEAPTDYYERLADQGYTA